MRSVQSFLGIFLGWWHQVLKEQWLHCVTSLVIIILQLLSYNCIHWVH